MSHFLLLSNHRVAIPKLASVLGNEFLSNKTLYLPHALSCFESNPWADVQKEFLQYDIVAKALDTQSQTIEEQLLVAEAIYLCGGNTFFLMNEIRRLELKPLFEKFLASGGLIIGESAGAVVLGPSIDWVRHLDSLDYTPKFIDFSGLNFFDFVPVPHFGLRGYRDRFLNITGELMEQSLPFIPITDNEVVLITDGSIKFIRD